MSFLSRRPVPRAHFAHRARERVWHGHAAEGLYETEAAARRSQIPMLVAMILFSTMSLWLLRQPMEMRLSWM